MDWFSIVKRHYDAGRYTKPQVAKFVVAGYITEAEYTMITGDVYGV
jgi:uncharacterized XkdX family phage protein